MAPPRLLTAYYLRQHMYTLVPRHVREDMKWMADTGTTGVALAVLENDLTAAVENLRIIGEEAHRVGIALHAVPSRWGGLFAGAPKVPSVFTATHPETWMRDADGNPYFSSTWGPMSSVHHPATFDFFCHAIETLLRVAPFGGIIWDEPKPITWDPAVGPTLPDHSEAARAAMPPDATGEWHIDAFAGFVDRLGAHARAIRPGIVLSMFLYGHLVGHPLPALAGVQHLDYLGCDGKPWALADLPVPPVDEMQKALLDQAPAFIDTARAHGKGGLMLIENHNMPAWGFDIMDRRLPDVFNLGAEHLLYYYFPRNVPDPDRQMAILNRRLRELTGRPPARGNDPAADAWHYHAGGQQVGPLPEAVIQQYIARGALHANHLVWRPGMSDWLPVAQVPQLARSLPRPAES